MDGDEPFNSYKKGMSMKAVIYTHGLSPQKGTFELDISYVPLLYSRLSILESNTGPVSLYVVEEVTWLLNRTADGRLEQDGPVVAITIRKL